MRNVLIPILTVCLGFWFTTAATAKPKLALSDEGLALQESRPLDRRYRPVLPKPPSPRAESGSWSTSTSRACVTG